MFKSADITNESWVYFNIYLAHDNFKSWVYDKTNDLYSLIMKTVCYV